MPDGLCARTPLTSARAVAVASPSVAGVEPRLADPLGDDLLLVGPIGAPQLGAVDRRRPRMPRGYASCPWQCLYFWPDPHGHGALRLTGASTTPPSASRCGSGGCGMLQRRQARQHRAASPASMSAVSSSPENGSKCWVMKSGSTRRRRGPRAGPARASASRVTSSRIDDQQPLEQQEGFLLIFVDRLLLRIAAQVDDLAQRVERREMLLPVMVERLDQDLLLDLVPALRLDAARAWRPSLSSASSCSRSTIISGSTASSCSQSSIGGWRPNTSSTLSLRPSTSHCSG